MAVRCGEFQGSVRPRYPDLLVPRVALGDSAATIPRVFAAADVPGLQPSVGAVGTAVAPSTRPRVVSIGRARLSTVRPEVDLDVADDRLVTSEDPDSSAIGKRFLNLQLARHRADHGLSRPSGVKVSASVAVHLLEARDLVAMFGDLPTGARREAAERAIRAYEARFRGTGLGSGG